MNFWTSLEHDKSRITLAHIHRLLLAPSYLDLDGQNPTLLRIAKFLQLDKDHVARLNYHGQI